MYDRIVNDNALTFAVSGMLYENGLIMFDRQTQSLWSHILGQGISGQYKGVNLEFVPALQTDWKSWMERHPDTLVVDPKFYGQDVYASYYHSDQKGVIGSDVDLGGKLQSKEYVIGVRLEGEARAYPFSILNDEPVVNDQVAGIPVAVFFDQGTASGAVFNRAFEDGTILEFEPGADGRAVIDKQTRSAWEPLTGKAISGPLEGAQLAQVPITYAFWFGWAAYHQEGTVYEGALE